MDLSMENLRTMVESMTQSQDSPPCPTVAEFSGCEQCDRGWIRHTEGDYSYAKKCDCLIAKETVHRFRRSGLGEALESCTFDSYKAEEPWQKAMKDTALRYTNHLKGKGEEWMFLGGTVGSGKSHLCTAVCGELMRSGRNVKYMQWVSESRRLKALVTDEEAFDDAIEKYRESDILYIDDLLKQQHQFGGIPKPTDADIRVVFEIINDRYNRRKPTIISSEWTLTKDLMDADPGAFSRIYERAKGFMCELTGADKNYRLKG